MADAGWKEEEREGQERKGTTLTVNMLRVLLHAREVGEVLENLDAGLRVGHIVDPGRERKGEGEKKREVFSFVVAQSTNHVGPHVRTH